MKLAKKIPVFNKRAENLSEIIWTLCDCNVPITRAVWYIKMLAAQATNLNEVQKKKRQTNLDQSNEWTIPLVKLLRELYNRLKDCKDISTNTSTTTTINSQTQFQQPSFANIENFMTSENTNLMLLISNLTDDRTKYIWDYTTKLMRFFFFC